MNDENDFEIESTEWIILKPRNNFYKVIDILGNAVKFNVKNRFDLEEIFSKKPLTPKLINYDIINLKEDQIFIHIETTDQKKIETIGGAYFYQFKKSMNLIFTEQIWLIDNDFFNIIKTINTDHFFEPAEINWTMLRRIILECKRAEIRNFDYIINNSPNYGRIFSISAFNPRSDVFGRDFIYKGGSDEIIHSRYLTHYEDVNKISFHTYLPERNKLRWTIYKNGKLRINKTNKIGVEKIIEFILDFAINNILYFQLDIYDFV